MNAENLSKPAIRQGWLRVLLFFVVYFLAVIALSMPAALLVTWFKREDIKKGISIKPGDLLNSEFLWLIVVIALAGTLLVVFVFRKFIDRKSFKSLGFKFSKHRNDAATGFFLGPAILGLGSVMLYSTGHLQWTDIIIDWNSLLLSLVIFIMVAFTEEIAFRGYILNNLMDSFNKWLALFISAIMFSLFHLGNSYIGFIPLANIFLAGILLGINYIYTRNLWFGIFLHISWNFFQGPLLGFKVSGININSLLQTDLQGSLMITGGNFGFEGSIIDMALTLITILTLYWIYEKKFKDSPSGEENNLLIAEAQ
jgi:membrane protease YdiL (CAAX protease family)